MIVLSLEPETRWDSMVPGFRRHGRVVQVAGPGQLWRQLESPGCCPGHLLSQSREFGLEPSLVAGLLSRLKRFGFLEELLQDEAGGGPLLARQITGRYSPTAAVAGQTYSFSRFAFLRKHNDCWTLESSRGLSRLRLLNEKLLDCLSEAREPLADWQRWLVESDILISSQQRDLERRSLWSFSDRLFHQRTRNGNHHEPSGKRLQAQLPLPTPAESEAQNKIFLDRPPAEAQSQCWNLWNTRRSQRQGGGGEWSLRRVEEFLHFSLASRANGRPYPSAGGVYEIEVLLGCKDGIAGVAAGWFRYLPEEHALLPLPVAPSVLDEVLAEHQRSCLSETQPTLSILLAARFEKIFRRYDSIAYALILKNAGVLMHQFSLGAALMSWGGCPIGTGSSEIVARLTGEDSEAYAAVGEFALW